VYEAKILEYLQATWNAVANMGTIIPGGLSQERSINANKPYALVRITPDKIPYLSDQSRQSIYVIQFEAYSDNSDDTTLENIDTQLEAFLAALVPGATVASGGGSGSGSFSTPTGKLIFAWRIVPGGQGLQTDEERRAGNDVLVQRMALRFRVQWY